MKILYIDCSMGAAGDMLTAALLELLPDPDSFVEKMNALGIPGVEIRKETAVKCGITGTQMRVTINGVEEGGDLHGHTHEHGHGHSHDHGGHQHSSVDDIGHIVRGHLDLPEEVADDVMSVYGLIAEAESKAHGMPVTQVHFHEVGMMDAVADITAVCLLMHEIAPDVVVASPVHVGSGQVRCAHGILPVPAPATATILQGVPIYGGDVQGELCTPTGAALLRHFVTKFGAMPAMTTQAIGYGMGKKDFERANCVRVMLGEAADTCGEKKSSAAETAVTELTCNIDDMTAEEVAYGMEKILEGGALDVFAVPAVMKKGRPGTVIHVLCRQQDKEDIVKLIFKHTSTIGIRETEVRRYVLDRQTETIDTEYGPVRRKVSSGYGVTKVKYEYEDLARIADERNISLDQARGLIE